MSDDVKKEEKPTAQVYRLASVGTGRAIKDLGPTGGRNPGDAVQPNAFEPEDEYQQLYVGATRDLGIVQPPYALRTLDRLSQENNALGPCIEAMVTNIDGTGYGFEARDNEAHDDRDDAQIDALKAFFDQPWPGMSFSTMRKLLRRDKERTGNAYIEVLRNAQDEIVFARRVDAKMMRMLRLDDAVPVEVTVTRNGKLTTMTVMQRERRYCQLVNGVSLMYFKEFGSKRDLHKKTAVWAPQGQRLPANARATEILHLNALPDSHTPYGVPRWVNQIPSVLGSRKAEEFNLEFFDNGGVPPILILLQGGTLQAETRRALEKMTSGEAKKNNRVQILEVEPNSGTLTQATPARVTVERFGAERQQDSMFEKYDQRCEERVRRSFRLPPIFVGQASDYNFACYDEQTETLTDHGWIKWHEFRPGMKVACYDPSTKALTYREPNGGALVYDVENVQMHKFAGESLDIMVTPKHRMHWTTQHGAEKTASIEEMLGTCTRPRLVARIDNYDEGEFLLDFAPPWVPLRGGSNLSYDRAPWSIPAVDFLELVGWYVSEGHALKQGAAISICQRATRHWPRIEALFARLENRGYATWRAGEHASQMRYIYLSDNSMYWWLLINAGDAGHKKRVPALIKGLCKAQLAVFFDALMAGDGTWDVRADRNSGAYSTTSKELADDVQEIAVKLGYRTKLREEPPGTEGIRAVYRVLLSKGARAGGDGRLQAVRYEQHHSRESYTGKVYCFSVPTGIFVTRRNGVVAAQGNTAFASYTVAEAQVFKPERDEFDEIMSMRLLPALGYDGYRMRSKPLVIEDATLRLQGLEVAMGLGDQVEPADIVEAINEIAGIHLKVSEDAPKLKDKIAQQNSFTPLPPGATHTMDAKGNITPINPAPKSPTADPVPGSPGPNDQQPGKVKPKQAPNPMGANKSTPVAAPTAKSDLPNGHELALNTLKALRKRDFAELASNLKIITTLDDFGRDQFNDIVTGLTFVDPSLDPNGLAELSACTLAVMAGQPHDHHHTH